MSKILQDVNDKIEKLWKLLAEHNKALDQLIQKQGKAIENRDFEVLGEISGNIVMVSQSDVCYATLIEVLEDLRKSQGIGG